MRCNLVGPLLAAFEHAALVEDLGDPHVIEATAEVAAKDLWKYEPRPRPPVAVANRRDGRRGRRGRISQDRHKRIESTVAVTLDDRTDRGDGLSLFE